MERISFLRALREFIRKNKPAAMAYTDVCGFGSGSFRSRGWAERGRRVRGPKKGARGQRANLVAGKVGGKLTANLLFSGPADPGFFNAWLEAFLFQRLPENSLVLG